MSRHSSSVVEFSLESTLALVYTCTMLHDFPSALELTQAYCSFVLFSPTPSIVFLVVVKKCAMALSEPLVDHRL